MFRLSNVDTEQNEKSQKMTFDFPEKKSVSLETSVLDTITFFHAGSC